MNESEKLRVGQRLWYQNKDNNKVGYIIVDQIADGVFYFHFDGKFYRFPLDSIGKRLFLSLRDIPLASACSVLNAPGITTVYAEKQEHPPSPAMPMQWIPTRPAAIKQGPPPPAPMLPPPPRKPSCDICAFRKNGECGSLSNQLCEDYKPTQHLTSEEIASFPKYGLATEYRMRRKK